MCTAILLAAAVTAAAQTCPCGPGCGCVGECYCVGAGKPASGDELPGLSAGVKMATMAHCDLVCYIGQRPAALGDRRDHCVYCFCTAIEDLQGSGVVTARWEGGQLGDWRWSRRQDHAEVCSMLDAKPRTNPVHVAPVWCTPSMQMGSFGGCGPGGCGPGGCGGGRRR